MRGIKADIGEVIYRYIQKIFLSKLESKIGACFEDDISCTFGQAKLNTI